MRADAANLLNRLGQTKFKYQEFSDSFADMELWPLFEALIRDPRIAGGGAEMSAELRESVPVQATVKPATTRATAPAEPRGDGLFGRYAQATHAAAPQEDVRSLLQQLNDRVASGQL